MKRAQIQTILIKLEHDAKSAMQQPHVIPTQDIKMQNVHQTLQTQKNEQCNFENTSLQIKTQLNNNKRNNDAF